MQAAIDWARSQRAVGRVRRGRRRLEHRHRQGGEPAAHQSRRAASTTSTRRSAAGRPASTPLLPLVAVPTTTGTGVGEHDGLRSGRPGAAGQERHQPRPAASDARRRRPDADRDPARRRSPPRPAWTSCATRWRATPRAPYTARRSQAAGAAGAVLRREPGLGHVVGEGDGAARGQLPPGGRVTATTCDARARHGARRDLRRAGIRQRGRAHPARERVPDRRPGARLPSGRVPAATRRWCRMEWRSRSPRRRRSGSPSTPARIDTSARRGCSTRRPRPAAGRSMLLPRLLARR